MQPQPHRANDGFTRPIREQAAPSRPEDVTAAHVAENLLHFGRRLRAAGLPVGSGQILDMVEAVGAIDVRRKDDFYAACKATLVNRPEHIPIFDAEFGRFWRDLTRRGPRPLEEFQPPADQESLGLPQPPSSKENKNGQEGGETEKQRDILVIEGTDAPDDAAENEEFEVPPEDVLIFSAREALRKKDFSQFSPEEIAEARRLIDGMNWQLGMRKTRRKERAIHGAFIDQRKTLRGSMKHGGVPVELRWRKPKERTRPLVLICDISGSMDRYSRLLLRFVHALEHGLDGVEVFVFGTRLTRITRELRKRDVDTAIQEVVASVDDWSGGTRIGEAIKTFNYKWSRRVLRSGATVVVISDGWDRGDPVQLGQEMAKLQRSCRRLIWLNPLLGAPGYQPLTQGIRAALPYVDHFLPVHNLKSLEALAELLSAVGDQPPVRRQIHAVPDARKGV
jgi:uncharacterized protein with von Willebrand factor type A (vWA) domain